MLKFTKFYWLTSIFKFEKGCYVKFNEKILQSIQIAFQNTFGMQKILKIDGATLILMRGVCDVSMRYLENSSQVNCLNWNEIKLVTAEGIGFTLLQLLYDIFQITK